VIERVGGRVGGGTARGREPRLVLRFAVCTALGLGLAAATILVLVRHVYTDQAQRQAIDRARFAADVVLTGRLRASDLARPVTDARRRQLDAIFRRTVLAQDTVSGTLYDARGRPTYTTGRSVSARGRARPPAEVRQALAGHVVSRVASTPSGSMLSTFLPVTIGPGGAKGVLVLDQDHEPIAAAARTSSLLIAGVLEALLLILFVVLLPVLTRAASRIRNHIAELDDAATHDELTGLPNRLGFRRAVGGGEGARTEDSALLLADLECFHELNDTLGSEAGDVLLEQVAARLTSELPGCELIARLGEDEFAVLCPASGEAAIARAADKLHESLSRPFVVHGVRLGVDARIGATVVPQGSRDVDTILRRASVALSVAKENRSGLEIYDRDQDAADVARLELTAALRDALAGNQLVVYYQPQADLSTRAVRGVEALVRWQHPQRGLLPAADFIPLAERTGLITDVGRFVLASAAEQWHELDARGIRFDVAVNLAAVDLLDVRLPDEIAALIERHSLPPEYLVLEITERTLLRDERRTNHVLERLHGIGVRLAIDDFGTGYSSLSYLRRLPVQQVKLDRTFVSEIPADSSSEAIIRSTVELAHTLGATVIAEGVETRVQWERLAALGCDIAQGYFVGRPLPPEDLTGLVDARPGFPVVVAA
jgi:diguanylate cyclase (GGDEF)-like protein